MNKLKLNEDKTEFFVASSKNNRNYINEPTLNVCEKNIKPSEAVRNLGVFLIYQCPCHLTSLQFHDL